MPESNLTKKAIALSAKELTKENHMTKYRSVISQTDVESRDRHFTIIFKINTNCWSGSILMNYLLLIWRTYP